MILNYNTDNSFHTQKGYELMNNTFLTIAMEDYLEMICRYSKEENYVRISTLSNTLNVKPSSSSKMVNKLKELDLVDFEKYGIIKPTSKGWEIGNYLLYRHDILHTFFCMLNHSTDELEQVEQVEHFINENTLRNIEWLVKNGF